MEKTQYIKKVCEGLEGYYDVKKNVNLFNWKIDLAAIYNNRTSKYMFTKNTELYAFENNEYIFFKNIKVLDKNYMWNLREFLCKNICNIIKISEEHMSSTVTVVLFGDVLLNEETKKAIKKFKYYKSFSFGLKGWVNTKLIFINYNTWEVHTNKLGKGDGKRFILKD